MVINRFNARLMSGWNKKRRLKLLAASLALATFLPVSSVFAEEITDEEVVQQEETVSSEEVTRHEEPVSAEESSTEEIAKPDEKNISTLNWVESEDYIFTAERIPTNRWDTPASIHVITAEEIERNRYQSVDEALSHVNGVVVIEGLGIFHSESASAIGTHMTGGNRILILIDGRRWFDPQSEKQEAKAYTGIPSIKMVERIEILKGGNSALYGSDAFNGVINIITKKGTRNETTVDLNTGTWRRHKYEITNQGVIDKFSWFVTGKLGKGQYWDYKNDSKNYGWFNEVDDYSDHNFSARFDYRFTDRSSMTLDFAHVSSHWSQDEAWKGFRHNNQINNVALSYNFKEGSSTPGWLRYVNNYYSKNALGSSNPHSKLQGIEYQNGWELGQHKIIAGFEWHRESAKYPIFGYDVGITTKSVYLQDTISLGEKWKVIPGVRYDHSEQFGSNWSPKIATNYRADERTKFYATWGRSYNSPLISELYSTIPSDLENQLAWPDLDRIRIGYKDLMPEKGSSLIFGFEHDFSDKSGVTVSLFQNKLKNYLDWFVDRGYWIGLYAGNTIPIKSRGIELTYRQKIDDHFSYNLGYSHTRSEFEHSTLGDVPLYRPQQNGYRIGLSYQNRGLRANLLGVMASGLNTANGQRWDNTDTLYSYPTKRYAVLNFNLNYDVNENFTLYFKALNLTNQCYSNYTSEYIDGGKSVHHSPGRSFIYGVDCKF